MLALHGVAVLVTRPAQQAAPLCHLLETEGATAIRLPSLEIKPCADRQELMTRLGPIEAFDLVIFTSANAVIFGAQLLNQRRGFKLAAIGPATARALDHLDYRSTLTPASGFSSEQLLLHPELQRLTDRRVLIVKGLRGRDLLRAQLAERGAQVMVAEVYQRETAKHTPEDLAVLEARFARGAIKVITATSVEIAAGLLALATPALRRDFDRVHWLVPSARVAAALRERGVAAPILQADSAEDHDLVAAIKRWRSSVSGA
jgi:uroporphyrinogen-III synthase